MLANPLVLGFAAGITVLLGAELMLSLGTRMGNKAALGALQALAGGILAYLALEAGHEAEELVTDLAKRGLILEFVVASAATLLIFFTTFGALSYAERSLLRSRGRSPAVAAAAISMGLGLHNVGEGFAIASSLAAGALASALLFTIGFAAHNATEGFAVVGPLLGRGERPSRSLVAALSLAAGLPVMPGAAVYYVGQLGDLWQASLYTAAAASIVYALLHVNLDAMSKLGGITSMRFWASLSLGVTLAVLLESIILLSIT